MHNSEGLLIERLDLSAGEVSPALFAAPPGVELSVPVCALSKDRASRMEGGGRGICLWDCLVSSSGVHSARLLGSP